MLEALIIGTHLYTQHFNTEAGYNNVNPGMYISAKFEDHVCAPTAGFYYNSERKESVWAGCTFTAGDRNQYRLIVGGVTGYVKGLTPLIIPQYNIGVTKDLSVGIGLIPPVKVADGGGLHFTMEWSFK